MRIRELRIARFGAWHNTRVQLSPSGLTVLYGPNETGKSTLVRFIRSMLYGFQPADELAAGARPRFGGCSGELVVESRGQEHVIERNSAGADAGGLRLDGSAAQDLDDLLCGVPREVYERVFAIGLAELQELATLEEAEVSRCIYHMSLGNEGARLAGALNAAEREQARWLDLRAHSGEILRRQAELQRLDAQIEQSGELARRHAELEREQARLEESVSEQRSRQNGLREQLRGHQFLERVWTEWSRQQQLIRERDALPDIGDFPADGAARLNNCEAAINRLKQQMAGCREKALQLQKDLKQRNSDREIERQAARVRLLIAQADSARRAESRLGTARQQSKAARKQLDERLKELGSGWSEARLEKFDGSPAAALRLFRQAARYRDALRRRATCIRAYRRRSAQWQQRQSELAALLRPYGGSHVDDVAASLREEIDALDNLRDLRSRWEAHREQLEALRRQDDAGDGAGRLPRYFYAVMIVLGCIGLALFVLGVTRIGAGAHAIARWSGAVFVLLGICCGGLTWTVRRQFAPDETAREHRERRIAQLQRELDNLEHKQRELASRCGEPFDNADDSHLRIAGRDGVDDVSDAEEIAERGETLRTRLAEIERAVLREEALVDERRRLAQLRSRIRELQRSVSHARRDWCQALKEVGLEESVRVAASLDLWRAVHQARQNQQEWRQSEAEATQLEQDVQRFQADVLSLAREIDPNAPTRNAFATVEDWKQRLQALEAARARRTELRKSITRLKKEYAALRRELHAQRAARRELLGSVGARNRDEFLQLERAWCRRKELQASIDRLGEQLMEIAADEPHLAVVEEDLRAFDPVQNRDAINTIEQELSDLDDDLRADHERLGRVKHELEMLEADRTLTALQFERAQAEYEAERAVHTWAAAVLAARGLEAVRSRLEAESQPETLERAGRYLRQLTLDKYRRVWAPLEEKTLVLDDDRRQSFRVDQLSSGSREQLFLALRLALLDRYLERGAELPIVLDDVFVNFDQQRTEAAVRTLIDYTRDGRQVVLMTCHLHLVRLFEAAGVRVEHLPEAAGELERRRVG